MNEQRLSGIGDFSQAVASPYADGLKEILMLFYLDSQQREKNFEMQQVGATAEAQAAKANGEAQEAAGREAATAMKDQASGEFGQALTGIGVLAAAPASKLLAKSDTFSLNGEEVKAMDTKITNMKAWDDAMTEANPGLLVEERDNGAFALREGNEMSEDEIAARRDELRTADKAEAPSDRMKENMELSKRQNRAEFDDMQDAIRTKREKLESTREDRQNQSQQQAFQQAFQLIQSIGIGIKGIADGFYAAPHKEREAEAQNLQQQAQFSQESIKRTLDSANQVNGNIYSAMQSLIDQVMAGMARVAYTA